jgi:hypothetical protein
MNNPLKALLVTVATVAVSLVAPGTAHAASGPDAYCFAKQATSLGVWVGTYAPVAEDGSCDAAGGLPMASHLTAAPVVTGQVWHIEIRWQFFDENGDLAFQTDQTGLLKLGTGNVVLNGTVTAGDRLGARTHDAGVPTDALGSYAGIMRVQS